MSKNIYSWGSGVYGQLGNNEENVFQSIPIKVKSQDDFVSIYAKFYNSFVFLSSGKVLSWGRSQQGSLGRSENGINVKSPIEFSLISEVTNKPNTTIQSFSVSREHGGLVTSDGKAYTWGTDYEGRLGNMGANYKVKKERDVDAKSKSSVKESSSNSTFGEIIVPKEHENTKYKQISCGNTFTTLLSTDGEVFTFGSNREACLGNDKDYSSTKKVNPDNFSKVDFFSKNNIEVIKIASGSYFSCGLSKTRELYCWGKNDYGQLGNGSNSSLLKSYTPVKVQLSEEIEDFEIGEDHAGVLTKGKRAYFWGYGFDGRLCNGKNYNFNTPSLINLPYEANKIALGGQHTMILDSNNNLYSCGNGRDGELGRGEALESSVSNRNLPMKIEYFSNLKEKIIDVKCGKNHTIVLTENI